VIESDTGGKRVAWLRGEVHTPPFSKLARIGAGWLLRRLQQGEVLDMPVSRPMTSVGRRCHELRIRDAKVSWRIVYRIDEDAIIIADVFRKTTRITPPSVIRECAKRLAHYDEIVRRGE
jgi:phage-related protein